MDYHLKEFSLKAPVRKCKGDGIGEVKGVLRWQSVVKSIHMVGLVTFLSGLPASLTPPPCVFCDGDGNYKGDRSLCVCVCVGVCLITCLHMFSSESPCLYTCMWLCICVCF